MAMETLDKMGASEALAVLKAVGTHSHSEPRAESSLDRILHIARVAAEATRDAEEKGRVVELPKKGGGEGGEVGGDKKVPAETAEKREEDEGKDEEARVKNCLLTSSRAVSLVARVAANASAATSQHAQGNLILSLLPFMSHREERVSLAAQDALLRVVHADTKAAITVLPKMLSALVKLLGDEESSRHKCARSHRQQRQSSYRALTPHHYHPCHPLTTIFTPATSPSSFILIPRLSLLPPPSYLPPPSSLPTAHRHHH